MPKTKSGKLIPYMSGGFNIDKLLSVSGNTVEGVTDQEKRELIMDVLKVGRGTVADLFGEDLNTAYKKALKGVEGNDDDYQEGGMNFTKRGPVKYSKGGAIRGKTFRGNY